MVVKVGETKKKIMIFLIPTLEVGPGMVALLVPIIVPLAVFTMIVLLNRNEKEVKMKMIEAGMNPDEYKHLLKSQRGAGGGALKFGAAAIGAGIGLFLAKILEPVIHGDPEAIYFGLVMIFGGLGLILGHYLHRKNVKDDELLDS